MRKVVLALMVLVVILAACKPNVSQADIDKAKLDSLTKNESEELPPAEPDPLPMPPVEVPEEPIEEQPPIEPVVNETNETVEEPVEETPEEPLSVKEPTDVTSEGDTPITQIFNFEKASTFTNRHVTYDSSGQNLVEVKTSVVEDALDGQLVWKLVSTIQQADNTLTGTMWIHKISLKCLKFQGAGGETTCPVLGPFGTGRTSRNVQFLGHQTLTVSLGEMQDARKYEGDGVTYWLSNTYPVPVKYSVQDGQNIAENVELVSVS